jgi:hypothetical protein
MVQQLDFAGFQVVAPGNNLEVSGLYSFSQDWLGLLQLLGDVERLGADGILHWIAGLTFCLLYGGFDGVQHGLNVARLFRPGHRCGDGTAMFMAKDQDQSAAQVLDSVFNASQSRSVHHFACGPDDKEIAKTLVEDDLRSDAGIRAADNDREWALALAAGAARFRNLFGSGMGQVPRNETGIALDELLERLVRSDFGRFGGERTNETACDSGQSSDLGDDMNSEVTGDCLHTFNDGVG